jgi:hypothetical protein
MNRLFVYRDALANHQGDLILEQVLTKLLQRLKLLTN